mgnify:CR=1 FL=1
MSQVILLLFITGILGGLLAGALGVGGGIIFVPVIQWYLSEHQITKEVVDYTLANSFCLVFFIGLMGLIIQKNLKHYKIILITGLFAVLSSLITTYLFRLLEFNSPIVFKLIFSIILIITIAKLLMAKKKEENTELILPNNSKFIPAGLVAGFITSISGLGGGIVMVPYFNQIFKLPLKTSTGLSLSVIPIIVLPLFIYYMVQHPAQLNNNLTHTGYVIWGLTMPVILGSMIGIPFGLKFSKNSKQNTLKYIFLVFLGITLIKQLISF